MPEEIIKIGKGEIGGKAKNFERLSKIISKNKSLSFVLLPKSVFVTTEAYDSYISSENSFSKELEEELIKAAATLSFPIAVRSSSLLEDQKGFSFAGKYESVLIGKKEDLLDAINTVFESTKNQNAISYREKHGFKDSKEKMAVILQEIVGTTYKEYFLPAMAGVAFSQNGYCWNKEINKKDGLVRLVMGLGTRAVGRGYVRLFSPVKPSMRPEGTDVNNIQKCSQKKVDAIDLNDGKLKTVHFRELITDGFNSFPGAQSFVSLRDGNYIYRPVSNLWDESHLPILTMDGPLNGLWNGFDIPKLLRIILKELETDFSYPVDVEFAINDKGIHLLQVRPLSERENKNPEKIPEIEKSKIIFYTERNLPTATIDDIEYLVFVDDKKYHDWPRNDRQSVARVVGKINELLKGKKFILVGPGRWGSWNPDLGVPVNYSEISNAALLVEVARRKATYVPEVSFGSHFFQDLIEDNIAYLPLYPDEPKEIFNEEILNGKSSFLEILNDNYYKRFDPLIKIIRIPSKAILNGEEGKAAVFIS